MINYPNIELFKINVGNITDDQKIKIESILAFQQAMMNVYQNATNEKQNTIRNTYKDDIDSINTIITQIKSNAQNITSEKNDVKTFDLKSNNNIKKIEESYNKILNIITKNITLPFFYNATDLYDTYEEIYNNKKYQQLFDSYQKEHKKESITINKFILLEIINKKRPLTSDFITKIVSLDQASITYINPAAVDASRLDKHCETYKINSDINQTPKNTFSNLFSSYLNSNYKNNINNNTEDNTNKDNLINNKFNDDNNSLNSSFDTKFNKNNIINSHDSMQSLNNSLINNNDHNNNNDIKFNNDLINDNVINNDNEFNNVINNDNNDIEFNNNVINKDDNNLNENNEEYIKYRNELAEYRNDIKNYNNNIIIAGNENKSNDQSFDQYTSETGQDLIEPNVINNKFDNKLNNNNDINNPLNEIYDNENNEDEDFLLQHAFKLWNNGNDDNNDGSFVVDYALNDNDNDFNKDDTNKINNAINEFNNEFNNEITLNNNDNNDFNKINNAINEFNNKLNNNDIESQHNQQDDELAKYKNELINYRDDIFKYNTNQNNIKYDDKPNEEHFNQSSSDKKKHQNYLSKSFNEYDNKTALNNNVINNQNVIKNNDNIINNSKIHSMRSLDNSVIKDDDESFYNEIESQHNQQDDEGYYDESELYETSKINNSSLNSSLNNSFNSDNDNQDDNEYENQITDNTIDVKDMPNNSNFISSNPGALAALTVGVLLLIFLTNYVINNYSDLDIKHSEIDLDQHLSQDVET